MSVDKLYKVSEKTTARFSGLTEASTLFVVSVISLQSNRIHNIHTNRTQLTQIIKMKKVKTVPLYEHTLAKGTSMFLLNVTQT